MTIWLSWMDQDDAAFRAAYEALVPEKIQDDPIHKDGSNLIGSSRCTLEQANQLAVIIPSVVIYDDFPAWFNEDDTE